MDRRLGTKGDYFSRSWLPLSLFLPSQGLSGSQQSWAFCSTAVLWAGILMFQPPGPMNFQPQLLFSLLCDLTLLAFEPLSKHSVTHQEPPSEREQGTQAGGR